MVEMQMNNIKKQAIDGKVLMQDYLEASRGFYDDIVGDRIAYGCEKDIDDTWDQLIVVIGKMIERDDDEREIVKYYDNLNRADRRKMTKRDKEGLEAVKLGMMEWYDKAHCLSFLSALKEGRRDE